MKSNGNGRIIKLAALVLFCLALLVLASWEEDKSPIGRIIVAVSSSETDVWMAGGAIFLVILAGAVWFIASLFSKKRSRCSNGAKKIATIAVSIGLSQLILLLPSQAATGVTTVAADELVAGQPVAIVVSRDGDVALTAEERVLVDSAVYAAVDRLSSEGKITGPAEYKVGLAVAPLCAIKVIIVLVVIGGVIYIAYKIYKACKKIGDNWNKTIEEEDPGETNSVRNLTFGLNGSEGSVTYAASLFAGYAFPAEEDGTDCDCLPPFSFRYMVPVSTSTPITLTPYIPVRTVDLDSFLLNHGLSTNVAGNSYSVNGIPTNELSLITYSGNTAQVTLGGMSNTVTVVERSTNLVAWEELRRLSAPSSAIVSFGDSEMSSCRRPVFYRVRVD